MSDVCVTVPKGLWLDWLYEGDLPDEVYTGDRYHFWLGGPLPEMQLGDRVYIVAYGRLRGYAPLVAIERRCKLRPSMGCLVREGGAVAVTIDRPIRGFRGFKYRWWGREEEHEFLDWKTAGLPADLVAAIRDELGIV